MNKDFILMIKGRFSIVLILLLVVFASCNKKEKFSQGEVDRKYILHLPKNLPDNAPLVFAMHGYTNKAGFIKFYTRMNKIANDNGFAVVYPQGEPDDTKKENTHWNADLEISEVDDISFIVNLAEELQIKYNLNPERTFAFGISNGGFMAYTLACKAPEKFAAVASIIGTMSGKSWEERDLSTSPVPILQVSGLLDETVPVDGSMPLLGGWGGAPPVDSIMSYWALRNNCTSIEKSNPTDHAQVVKYENGTNGSMVWYYLIDNLKHTYPNKRKHELKTSELIWEFFSQF